jgi:thiol-disulfide isomerase/thioredoxin
LLTHVKETVERSYLLQQFKNNILVFSNLLEQQRFVDTAELKSDLQIGDAKAPVQLLVACNPYCNPCARTHHFLHDYLEKKKVGFTIRFVVNADNMQDKKTKAVVYLLQLLESEDKEYRKKVLYDWYRLMDIDKFSQLYPLEQPPDVKAGLLALQQWKSSAKIKFTPTVFINGYELPDQYSIYDLPVYINRMMTEQTVSMLGKEKKLSEAEPV